MEIDYLTWWNFPKKAWLIIIGELGVITSLSIWLYSTYLNDIYFQTYANSLSPILVPVLSVAFGISSASIATYLYLGMKRIRTTQGLESPIRKKVYARKPPKRSLQSPISPTKAVDSASSIPAKLRPLPLPSTRAQTQKPAAKEREDPASNSQPRKEL